MERKYNQIRSIEELDDVIRLLSAHTRRQSVRVRRQLSSLESVYTPQNLLTEGFRRMTHSVTFYGAALSVISFVRKRLRKK